MSAATAAMPNTLQRSAQAPGAQPAASADAAGALADKQIGDVILDVSNISLRFGGVKALTDISFNVREHEVRSIIGPNGAGKSSMLNLSL
ncbi:MAG: ATP-binding cassette domain-containing protein, partial [Leptothrix sp. (in: b-proteobacteria)]